MNINSLSGYLKPDREKKRIIDDLLFPKEYYKQIKFSEVEFEIIGDDICASKVHYEKYCPKCQREYPGEENFCYDCLCSLKYIDGRTSVRDIESKPEFTLKGSVEFNGFDEIFTPENIKRMEDFKFNKRGYNRIIKNIKTTALKNMDSLAKANEIDIQSLNNLDQILLFSKSFVEVGYKSHGVELGNFEFDKITIDDRQTSSLQITTLIHELSHFILKEIISQIICVILDCTKNSFIEAISVFILSYSPFTCLIDEYCAHTVEGRFAVFGYQDYSSFLSIEESLDGQMPSDDIEITKSIGNTFASSIKDIMETFIDGDLRDSIKSQFLAETHEEPNYKMLLLENCNNLTNDGLIKAIWLILNEGFEVSCDNQEKLDEYEKCF